MKNIPTALPSDHRLLQPLLLLTVSVVLLTSMIPTAEALQSSQAWSLLRLQRLLNYPQALSTLTTTTTTTTTTINSSSFCSTDPSPSFFISCYGDSITQLHISGPRLKHSPPLPAHFSIDSLFTTLTRLRDLKVLTLSSLGLWGPFPSKIWRLPNLEILDLSSNYLSGPLPQDLSYLRNLQTLILDGNHLGGPLPEWLTAFPLLAVLSLSGNSFHGSLPRSLQSLESLRVLRLSANNLTGEVPDLSGLSNLQLLDLEDNNGLGPQFPSLQRKVVTVLLRKNKFTGSLPAEINSYYLLQRLDVSVNCFVGPLPTTLLSLPSIKYLNISGNRFTGMMSRNSTPCGEALEVVDLSSNLLTGSLPGCLDGRNVSCGMNCLGGGAGGGQQQHPLAFCQTEAMAVGGLPPTKEGGSTASKPVVVTAIVGGVVVAVALVGVLVFLIAGRRREWRRRRAMLKPPRRLVEHASNGYQSKILSNARYIFQTGKPTTLDIIPYRSFSLEELEAATNNFNSSVFMGEGCDGEMYKGKLGDGSLVAIRCLKLKRSHSSQSFSHHIELMSKLKHQHLVSALGHCFELYLESSTVSRLFLVFEYIPNGTLRKHICEGIEGEKLTWIQRISAAIGIAKGLQFLHCGIMPGLFGNNLSTSNILLDQNLVAKISSYNLPALEENIRTEHVLGGSMSGSKDPLKREKFDDKIDIYNFGIILLEIVSGRAMKSNAEVDTAIHKLHTVVAADGVARRRSLVDQEISRECSNESLRTVTDICLHCLSKEPMDRPSVEDVLWNLHFAIQVQDVWRGDSQSSEGSLSPSQYPPQSLVSNY